MPALRFFRLDALIPATLLVAGSIAFISGGRNHPIINPNTLGPFGSEQFYRGFAHEMIHTPGWHQMHLLILVGPVLWALGASAVSRLLPGRVAALGEVGRAALLLAAAGWVMAFVLDGFVGPRYAAMIVASESGAADAVIAAFSVNALTMARLGTISVVLIGAGVVSYSLALLAVARSLSWGAAVGGVGILVGGWPLIAAMRGEFNPGPFSSPYWMVTALSIGLWMALFATALPTALEGPAAERANASPDRIPSRLTGAAVQ